MSTVDVYKNCFTFHCIKSRWVTEKKKIMMLQEINQVLLLFPNLFEPNSTGLFHISCFSSAPNFSVLNLFKGVFLPHTLKINTEHFRCATCLELQSQSHVLNSNTNPRRCSYALPALRLKPGKHTAPVGLMIISSSLNSGPPQAQSHTNPAAQRQRQSKYKGLNAFTIHLQEQRNLRQQPVVVTPVRTSAHPHFSAAPARSASGREAPDSAVIRALYSYFFSIKFP